MPRKKKKTKVRKLNPKGGNDLVYTPDWLAELIVHHFKPSGRILEPCSGKDAFVRQMPGCDSMELDRGQDFLALDPTTVHWDWIVTNPPYSKHRDFLKKSLVVADNIVFLGHSNTWMLKARQNDIQEAGFGIVEMMRVPTPKKPWPQAGFSLSATWIRRGWQGSCHMNNAYKNFNLLCEN